MARHWSDQYSTVELTKIIRRMATVDRLSPKAIAEKIGLGLTKNMVSGLAHRARPQITFSADEVDSQSRVVAARNAAADRPVGRLKFVIVDEVFDSLHQLELRSNRKGITDGRCRFPLWPDRIGSAERVSTSELMYCGAKCKDGSSWCEKHHVVVYEPAPPPVLKGQGKKRDTNGRRMGWEYGT